ncbi:MAG: hypothetical protein K6G85_08440 [Eubacterium sp.]|nr:hypothetical protein [Eubacterium sp.]
MQSLKHMDDFDDEVKKPAQKSTYEAKWEGLDNLDKNIAINMNKNKELVEGKQSYPELKCTPLSASVTDRVAGGGIAIGFFLVAALLIGVVMESPKRVEGTGSQIFFCVIIMFLLFAGFSVVMASGKQQQLLRTIEFRGELMEGVVLGYEIDKRFVNSVSRHPLKACVIAIETLEGKRIIKYTIPNSGRMLEDGGLYNWEPPYALNEVVDVLKYGDYYYVQKRKNHY